MFRFEGSAVEERQGSDRLCLERVGQGVGSLGVGDYRHRQRGVENSREFLAPGQPDLGQRERRPLERTGVERERCSGSIDGRLGHDGKQLF